MKATQVVDTPFVNEAKKDAKRLLKLVQEGKVDAPSINSLSDAQALIAMIKGKSNWHELIKTADKPVMVKLADKISGLFSNDRPHRPGDMSLGTEIGTNRKVGLTEDEARTHVAVFGGVGSGKSRALQALALESMMDGMGVIYVDGKGDNTVFPRLYAYARAAGREDDILLLNFMFMSEPGARGQVLSNTWNPFDELSASSLTQLIIDLIDDGSPHNMWHGRAIALIAAVMPALTWLRDQRGLRLNAGVIREHLALDKMIELSQIEGLPRMAWEILDAYFKSLPGFVARKGADQSESTLDQHGYLQMQFTRLLGALSDVYSHIFMSNASEINIRDVIAGKKILVIQLPAMEKSPGELANLGRIVVAAIKLAINDLLAHGAPAPARIILDDAGYYMVPGLSVLPSQARAAGVQLVFAASDMASLGKVSPEEAQAVIGNCATKIFMRLDNPIETLDLYMNAGGHDQDDAALLKQAYAKLSEQQPGEAIVINQGAEVAVKMTYVQPKIPGVIKLNH